MTESEKIDKFVEGILPTEYTLKISKDAGKLEACLYEMSRELIKTLIISGKLLMPKDKPEFDCPDTSDGVHACIDGFCHACGATKDLNVECIPTPTNVPSEQVIKNKIDEIISTDPTISMSHSIKHKLSKAIYTMLESRMK